MGTEGVGGCAIRKRYKIMLVGNFCGFLKPSTHTYWTRNRSEFTFTCTSPCPPPRFTCCGAGHEWSQQKKQTKNSPPSTFCTTTPYPAIPPSLGSPMVKFFFHFVELLAHRHWRLHQSTNGGWNRSLLKWHIGKVRPQGFCGAR